MPARAQELALDRFADIRVAGSGGRTVTVVAETGGELAENAGRYQKHGEVAFQAVTGVGPMQSAVSGESSATSKGNVTQDSVSIDQQQLAPNRSSAFMSTTSNAHGSTIQGSGPDAGVFRYQATLSRLATTFTFGERQATTLSENARESETLARTERDSMQRSQSAALTNALGIQDSFDRTQQRSGASTTSDGGSTSTQLQKLNSVAREVNRRLGLGEESTVGKSVVASATDVRTQLPGVVVTTQAFYLGKVAGIEAAEEKIRPRRLILVGPLLDYVGFHRLAIADFPDYLFQTQAIDRHLFIFCVTGDLRLEEVGLFEHGHQALDEDPIVRPLYATQHDRERVLDQIANQLQELGFRHMVVAGLKPKHVEGLVERWKADGLAVGTIKNRMAELRWWAEKIGKQNVVARDISAPGLAATGCTDTAISMRRRATASSPAGLRQPPAAHAPRN